MVMTKTQGNKAPLPASSQHTDRRAPLEEKRGGCRDSAETTTAPPHPVEIADFYDAIVEKVAALQLNAQQTLASVKTEQQALASQLEEHLAQGESLRKADFQKLLAEVIEKRKAREQEVMAMLAQFQAEEQALAQGLKALFAEGRQVRLRDFKLFLAEAKKATEARREEVEEIARASQALRKSAEETLARFRDVINATQYRQELESSGNYTCHAVSKRAD